MSALLSFSLSLLVCDNLVIIETENLGCVVGLIDLHNGDNLVKLKF